MSRVCGDNVMVSGVPIRSLPPPTDWGVEVDTSAIDRLTLRWRNDPFPLPAWDYPGLPGRLTPRQWFDFCGLSVSVLACLWPPEGERMWSTDHQGRQLSDAPALFACFTRGLPAGEDGLDAGVFATWNDDDAERFFAGRGVLQLLPQRRRVLQQVGQILADSWGGHFLNLVKDAGFSAPAVVERLVTTFPPYRDEWPSRAGLLSFNKLAHLCAAMMAAGGGTEFTGVDLFPVYPDYMLPMVLRHFGVMRYQPDLAKAVDHQELIPAGSTWELAIRWATVYSGEQLTRALNQAGNPVTAPMLDFFLWHQAVLGPEAGTMGEHHRTLTMAY